GVVAGFVDLGGLGPALRSRFADSDRYEFLITTADGKTSVSRSVDSAQWTGVSLDGNPFRPSVGQGDGRGVDGAPRIYAQTPAAGHDWIVYAGVDLRVALTPVADLPTQDLWFNGLRLL